MRNLCDTILTGGQRERSRKRSPGPNALLVVSLALAVAGGAQAASIEWKFEPGEVLRYSLDQKTLVKITSAGRETKSNRSHSINLTWTVKNVAPTGVAEITHRIERVRLRIESPPFMTFEFDTDNPNTDAQGPFKDVAQQTRAMAGAEFSFKMKPSGEISDIVISPATIKSLRDSSKPPEGGGEELSEQTIKDMLLQSSPPPFPTGPLEIGKNWSSKPAKIPSPLGSIVTDKVFTFQGPDPKDGRFLLVGIEARVALEPDKNSPVSARIKSQEGKGDLAFDSAAGRIANSHSTEKMEMIITAMGQEIDQTTESSTSMTLQGR